MLPPLPEASAAGAPAHEPWRLPALALGRMIGAGRLSPVELLDCLLERAAALNPGLNAIIALDADAARRQALAAEDRRRAGRRLSLLDGVPVTVKDNIYVQGLRATWGSRLYRDFMPPGDDLAIARLRAAGLVLLGKTNTPEFALASHTDNLLFGPTRNPWNPALTPGGSSGGAAASVAAGLSPLAVGTDAGGSIRRPASYVGVVGFRPSTGRIPRCLGFPPIAHDFQAIAPMARTVDDVYALLCLMAGPDARDRLSLAWPDAALPSELAASPMPRLRIRHIARSEGPVDAPIRHAVAHAVDRLAALGHHVIEGALPVEMSAIEPIRLTLSSTGLVRVLDAHPGWRGQVGAAGEKLYEHGAGLTAADYLRALDALEGYRKQTAALLEDTDILAMPTSAALPWPIGLPYPPRIDGRDAGPRDSALFLPLANALGLPAVSIPVEPGPDGLPIGMQLVGKPGADHMVLQLARQFEMAHGWQQRWPDSVVR